MSRRRAFFNNRVSTPSIPTTPEYQSVLDYAVTNGISIPDTETNNRNNARVHHLKQTSLWGKFDLLYFFDQPNGLADFAKINYINPSSNYLYGSNQPSFVAGSGFKGNGTNQFFQTGYNPTVNAVNVKLNSFLNVFRGFGWTTDLSVSAIFGGRTGNNASQIFFYRDSNGQNLFRFLSTMGGGARFDCNNNLNVITSVNPLNYTVWNDRIDGIPVAAVPNPPIGSSFTNLEIYIFAINNNGSSAFFTEHGLRYWGIGGDIGSGTLNTNEVNLRNIMNDTYTP